MEVEAGADAGVVVVGGGGVDSLGGVGDADDFLVGFAVAVPPETGQ